MKFLHGSTIRTIASDRFLYGNCLDWPILALCYQYLCLMELRIQLCCVPYPVELISMRQDTANIHSEYGHVPSLSVDSHNATPVVMVCDSAWWNG